MGIFDVLCLEVVWRVVRGAVERKAEGSEVAQTDGVSVEKVVAELSLDGVEHHRHHSAVGSGIVSHDAFDDVIFSHFAGIEGTGNVLELLASKTHFLGAYFESKCNVTHIVLFILVVNTFGNKNLPCKGEISERRGGFLRQAFGKSANSLSALS